jgi:hypothetical protein
MHLPHQIQQDLEQWVTAHGLSAEEFILQAITEKLTGLKQQSPVSPIPPETAATSTLSSRLRRQDGILVIDVEPLASFDANAFIDELREERIQEQVSL